MAWMEAWRDSGRVCGRERQCENSIHWTPEGFRGHWRQEEVESIVPRAYYRLQVVFERKAIHPQWPNQSSFRFPPCSFCDRLIANFKDFGDAGIGEPEYPEVPDFISDLLVYRGFGRFQQEGLEL